jgi:hypothetical protein
VQHAFGHRAVAEEADRQPAAAQHRLRDGAAQRDRDAGTDDAIGTQDAQAGIGHVHRAATALADAAGTAHDLLEEAVQRQPARQHMAVPPVRGGQRVAGCERRCHAGGDRLLADTEVDEARHLAVGKQFRQCRLCLPHQQHRAVQREQAFTVVRGRHAQAPPPGLRLAGHSKARGCLFKKRATASWW